MRMACKTVAGKLKGRYQLEELVGGGSMLKWILKDK
jgi:hypothetical protein